MVSQKPDPRADLQAAIREMPDAEEFDLLLQAASVRLELLGFAELAEAVHDVASYGAPQVEEAQIPVVERFRTVAGATGWAMSEETKGDAEWGIATTTLTLTYGKNTIDASIRGRGMHLDHATWRIAGARSQFHETLAPQRKYRRVETVLEWMRRVVVEPVSEDEISR